MRSKSRIRLSYAVSFLLVSLLTLNEASSCVASNVDPHLLHGESSRTVRNQTHVWAPLNLFLVVGSPSQIESQASRSPLSFSPPTVAAVPFLISSLNRRDQAWAAYLIGQHGLTQFVPQLLQLLIPTNPLQPTTPELTEARALDRVILDTLIQLKAKVPGERLMSVYDEFRDEVVIVLASSPEDNEKILLSLHDFPQPDTRWFAICNLLASSRPEGFAARLLRDITIKISLLVSENSQNALGVGEGGQGGIGCGMFGMPKDFPPTSIYELRQEVEDGDVLLVEGVRPVYYRCQVVPMNQQIGTGQESTFNDRDLFRRDYLARLLGTDTQSLAFNPRPSYSIRWTSAEAFAAQAKRLHDLHHRSFSQLATQLHDDGLLTSEESETLRPKLTFAVHDLRTDKTIVLPSLGPKSP